MTTIQQLIYKEINSIEIEKRRILVGNSSDFQGDERDIIFLSMVDSPTDDGVLRKTGDGAFELIKKRYNVASSRARDQLWVIHSFDPDIHLKAEDIRLKLLQHIKDPFSSLRVFDQAVMKTESPFEKEVLKILTNAGYKVITQWNVGYYRIDMVVEGGGKRLAVECDGDRFHPIEKLAEDMERQTILERLGWQFIRIRGSAFYRDADSAMRPVFAKLEELDIPKDANKDVPDSMDFTLIHELNEIVSREKWAEETNEVFVNGMEEQQLYGEVISFSSAESPSEIRKLEEFEVEKRINKNISLYQEYKVYQSQRGNPDLFYESSSRSTLIQQLIDTIEAEGPIADFVLFRRIARAWSLSRTGNRIENLLRNLIPKDIKVTKEKGVIFYWPSSINSCDWVSYRVPGQDSESKRSLDEISVEEIGNIILALFDGQVNDNVSDVARIVCRSQKIARTSVEAEERVSKALAQPKLAEKYKPNLVCRV